MPRGALQDYLQVFPFWLMDVAPIEALALPIFTPLFGFSSITAPEVNVEVHEIQEGNWEYTRKVVKSASISTMTLQRGATFYDSDFWRWMHTAVSGNLENFQSKGYGLSLTLAGGALNEGIGENAGTFAAGASALGGLFGFPRVGGPSYRRNLLLIQFFARLGSSVAGAAAPFSGAMLGAATGNLFTGAALGVGAAFGLGGASKMSRLPAKAWMLKGCIPTRYKAAGDFDATSGEVSIQEMDVEVEMIDEISLAA